MEGATLHSALAIGSEDAGIQCRHCGAIIYGIQVAHGAGGYLHYGCKIEVEAMQQRASEEVRKRSEAKYELQLRRVVHKMSWSTARAKKVRRWHGGGVLGHCDSGCGGALEECSFVFQYACVVLAAVAAVSHCSMRALGWFVQRVAVLVAVVGSERIWHEVRPACRPKHWLCYSSIVVLLEPHEELRCFTVGVKEHGGAARQASIGCMRGCC